MRVCMYMYVCTCMYVCDYESMYVCVYVCMHVCMYVCIYVCMRVSVPSTEKKNSRVLPDSKQIYEKNVINIQMYVMNDFATHTYTICNLKQ